MEQPNLTKMMTQSISNVFETAFFQPVEIKESEKEKLSVDTFNNKALMGAFLVFSGGMCGSVYIVSPESWVDQVTADFLGIDVDEVSDAQKKDSIKEAVNMIAGHMFSLFDKDGEIQLGIPELIGDAPLTPEDLEQIKGRVHRVMTETDELAVITILES